MRPDLGRAVEFCRDALGSPLIAVYDPPGVAFFDVSADRQGGPRLLLDAIAEAEVRSLIYLRADDVAARTEVLRASGAEIVDEPHLISPTPDGVFDPPGEAELMALFRDSEGSLVDWPAAPARLTAIRPYRRGRYGRRWTWR